jgi:hypothetical protein
MFRISWRRLIFSLFRPTVRTIRKHVSLAARRHRLRLEHLEDRLAPAVTANFNNGLLSVMLGAAGDTASLAVVGANVEVRDGGNNLIRGQATNTITDISAAGNNSANQTINLNSDFVFVGLNSLSAGMVTTTDLNGNVTTAGDQSYTSAVSLGADTKLSAKDVTFASTVDGAHALEVASTTTTTFGGEVGAKTKLTTLTLDAGGTTAINTDMVLSTGNQTFNNAVTLTSNVLLDTTNGGAAGAAIHITGKIDADLAANNRTLTLKAGTGDIALDSAIGSGQSLASLTVASARNATFGGTIQTTGDVTQAAGTGTTTFNGTSGTGIGGKLSVTTDAIQLNTATLTTVGAVSLTANGDVTLNAGLNAGASTVTILANQGGTGTKGFTQNTGGDVTTTNATANAVSISVATGVTGAALRNITVGSGGTISVNANGGSITQAGGTLSAGTGTVTLTTGGLTSGIGTLMANINTSAAAINATAGSGGAFITNANGGNFTVTATDTGNIQLISTMGTLTVAGKTATPKGDITLCSKAGSIAVQATLAAAAGTVRLSSAAGISQTAAGEIDATNLGIRAAGDVALDQKASMVTGTFAAANSGANNVVRFLDDSSFGTGTVLGVAKTCFTMDTTGVSSADGDITLCTNGASLALNAAVNAGKGAARLSSSGGISQTAAITAMNLAVQAADDVTLDQATNSVTGVFAANDTGSLKVIRFLDGSGFSTGTVNGVAGTCFTATIIGVASTNGDVTLCAKGGGLSLGAAVNAGTGVARLSAGSDITQSAAITATDLAVQATGAVRLASVANQVSGKFAANGAGVAFQDGLAFHVGSISGVAGTCFTTTTTGISGGSGDVTLCAGGGFTIDSAISTVGTVRLAANGAISQMNAAAASISAANLGITANGNVTLDGSATTNNVSGNLAAQVTGGGFVHFRDISATGFSVGQVSGADCFGGATGIATTGDVALGDAQAGAMLNINNVINSGASAVRLALGNAITQANSASASITSGDLGITAGGNITLDGAVTTNVVTGNVAIQDSGSGDFIHFRDTTVGGFTVKSVTSLSVFGGATGVATTGNGDIALSDATGGAKLTLSNVVNAGAGTVRLALGGAVSQDNAAVASVTAGDLGVMAGGNVTLDGAATVNMVTGNFAANNSSAGSFVHFLDTNAAGFTAGSVGAASSFGGATGVTTMGGGEIALTDSAASANLTINNVVTAAGAGRILLTFGSAITQMNAASASITGGSLGLSSGSSVSLAGAATTNAVGRLAAMTKGALAYQNVQALSVGTVNGMAGINAGGNDVTLTTTAGMLTIGDGGGQGITAAGKTTDLNAFGVMEMTNSTITAANARLQGLGAFMLNQANAVGTLAAAVTGALNYQNNQALVIGTVKATPGVNTGGNDVTLRTTAGMLTLGTGAGEGIMAAGATADLTASGVLENANSTLTSANARFLGTGTYALGQANAIGTLAAAVNGSFTLKDSSSLTVGRVLGNFGISTGNNPLTLTTDQDFTVNDNLLPAAVISSGDKPVMVQTGMGAATTQVRINVMGEIATSADATIMGGQGTRMISGVMVPVANAFLSRPAQNGTVTHLVGNPMNLNHMGSDTLVLQQLTDSGVKKIRFIPGTDPADPQHSGTFQFSADPWQTTFTHIGVVQGESIQATSVQASNNTVEFVLNGSLSGTPLEGISTDFNVMVNPFLLSPVFSSPPGSFSVPAPRVAVADVTGNGFQDLILASGPGSRPVVAVIDGRALIGRGGKMLQNSDLIGGQPFFAFPPDAATGGFFTGGLNVAAGDLDGSGAASIVVSMDAGGSPLVRVFKFKATTNQFQLRDQNNQFMPYDSSFHGGVRVAVGDNRGTHVDPITNRTIVDKPIIVVAPGPGAALPVIVFDATTLRILAELTPYGANYQDGIYVAAGNFLVDSFGRKSTSNDIVTAPEAGRPLIKVYHGENLPQLLTQVVAFQADQPNVVTYTNQQLATGFLFKVADPDPAHPHTVAAPAFGTNSVAMGPINPITGTRDLIVTTGIGQRAVQSTISVNSSVNPNNGQRTAAKPALPTAKRSMFFRARSPRGVNVSSSR